MLFNKRKKNVFCIGFNKTGTTSLTTLLNKVGYKVGPQLQGELLIKDYAINNFKPIIKFVKKSKCNAFQDIPFSLPDTYKYLSKNFPESKFILTVRDSEDVWYNSLTRFHSSMFGLENRLPTEDDLLNSEHVYKGWMWDVYKYLFGTPKDDLYNKDILCEKYLNHNQQVIDFFKNKPNKLLIVNLNEKNVVSKICSFLNIKNEVTEMPWDNKS